MSKAKQQLADALRAALAERSRAIEVAYNELTVELAPEDLLDVAVRLRDDDAFRFQQLIDLCGVDYSQYGCDEWQTDDASHAGFTAVSRAAAPGGCASATSSRRGSSRAGASRSFITCCPMSTTSACDSRCSRPTTISRWCRV